MADRPKQSSFRLSDDDRYLLAALSKAMGVNQTAVMKLSIRDKAKAEGVKLPPAANDTDTILDRRSKTAAPASE